MAKTIGNYTWEDTYGVTAAKDGTNIGIRCYLYLSATESYGSCYAFFNISYTPLSGSKLRVKINSIQLRQDEWSTRDWVLSGSVKVNGTTLFNKTVSTPSGTTYGANTNISVGNAYYVDIDYPNSSGSLPLTYDFSLYFKTDISAPAGWKGWTNSEEDICSTSYTYSHTHNWSSSITMQPTCTTTGIKTYTCSGCENTYTESIPLLGHTYMDATCTTPKTCSVCGATEGEPLEHTWDSGIVTTPSTYEATGIKTHTCSVCNETKEETLTKLIVSIFIDNGENLDAYSIYIDDGEEWHPYILYIDDGVEFAPYC